MSVRNIGAASAASLALLAALTACAPGGAGAQAKADSSAPVSTDLPDEDVTLTLMSTPESGASTQKTIEAFEKANPQIDIEYEQTNYDDYNKSLNLALSSDSAPDIALLNSVGTTVKNGLVRDLTGYAEAYDWESKVPANQLAQWRVAEDGTTLGDGPLYAAPAGFSEVGVYYNKALAKKVGLTAMPQTLEEFEAALEQAKSKGVLPLQLGNAEGHASFVVQLVGQSTDGPSAYTPWVFGHDGATFDTEGNQQGLELLASWAKAGYVPEGANGTDLQTAVANFVEGEGLFFIDGNWDASKIADGLGADAGYFAFPGEQKTAIGTSVAYAISSKSENPDAAAAFLDFLGSAEAGEHQFEQGFLPVDPAAVTPEEGTLQADLVAAWSEVVEDDGLVGFNNNASPTMNDTLTATTQELLAGKIDPAKAVEVIQGDWDQTHGNG